MFELFSIHFDKYIHAWSNCLKCNLVLHINCSYSNSKMKRVQTFEVLMKFNIKTKNNNCSFNDFSYFVIIQKTPKV